MENYQDHYRLLGIVPGDSWQKLRGAYKSRMRRWHPDRFGQSESARRQAEEKSKQINRAYQELNEYYEQHGKLPLDVPPPATIANQPRPAQSDTALTPDVPPVTDWSPPATQEQRGRGKFITVLLGVITLLLLGALLWGPDNVDPAREPPATDTTVPTSASLPPVSAKPGESSGASDRRFGDGSTLGEVYTIQGVPTKVEGDIWHYGDARVYFQNGRVTRWSDSEPPRLKVQSEAGSSRMPAPAVALFTRGSSKHEVRAIQGAPLRESAETWDYGLSRVYFDRNGRVSGWQESPLDPLRVER